MNAAPPDHLPDFSSFPLELEALYATAPLGLCVLDTQFRYLRINQRLADSNGFSVEQHLGKTVRDMVPNLADSLEPLLQEIVQTGETRLNIAVSGETASQPGVIRYWDEHFLPIKRDDGQVIAINVTVVEITEHKHTEARFRFLNEAGEALASSLDYELTLTRVAQLAVPVVADWCVVDIADEDGALHRLAITHAVPDKYDAAQALKQHYPVIMPDAEYTLVHVMRTGKTWFDPEVSQERFVGEARDADHLRLLRELGFKSEIVVPLKARGKLLGGLTFVYGTSNRRYTTADVEWLEALGRRAALAIDNARLYREAQLARREADQAAARIYFLQEITSALSRVKDVSALVDIALNRAVPLLGAHIATIFLLSPDGTTLHLVGQSGIPPQLLEHYGQISLSAQFPGTDAFHTGEPVWIECDQEYADRYPHLMDVIRSLTGTQALATLPLLIHGKAGGIISFSFSQPRDFNQKERALFAAIADQCAQTIDRIGLSEKERHLIVFEERQRLARELHDAVSQTLTAATMMAESAGRFWEKDQARVLEIVRQVARLNHVAQAELRTLLWELRPETILKTKPGELLHQLVDVVNGRKGIQAELICEGDNKLLPEPVHIAVYRIAQESLNNAVKHSQASRVSMRLWQSDGRFALQISDNGRGFNTGEAFAGLGLGTMRERAVEIGATLAITSQPGAGTTIRLSGSA